MGESFNDTIGNDGKLYGNVLKVVSLKKDNDLIYSRVDIVSDVAVRIVYSTISDTKCALAKVYLQN